MVTIASMTTRRPQGTGSATEREPGVWRLRYAGHSATFHGGRKAAEKELRAMITRTPTRRGGASRTIADLIGAWIPKYAGDTRTSYEAALAHVPAEFKARKVAALDLRDFDNLYAHMTANGVSAPTVRKAHTALSAALTEAIRWRWISTHPARGARLPSITVTRVAIPSDADVVKLLGACRTIDESAWMRLVLATGARRSEILALRWSHLDGARLTISGSLTEDRRTKSTKTNAVRTVLLDAATVATLGELRAMQLDRAAACGGALTGDWWMFAHDVECSQPWRPDGVTQRFRRLCKRAGVTGVKLHSLRHWHASQLLRAGGDILAVSARLGHSRTSTTLDTYGHVLDGRDAAQAELIAGILDAL